MIITVDTGGTKTLVASFTSAGKPNQEHRFKTPRDTSAYISQLSALIKNEYDGGKHITGLCLAVPGLIKKNVVAFCPNLHWRNFDIEQQLKDKLPDMKAPIWLENDANLAGLAEAHALKKIPPLCLYVTISTGIGTGIIREGKIDPALDVSEGGHMVLEYDGILRHWEQFASGHAIYETYGKYASDISDESTWQQISDKISRGFLAIIPLLHPNTIVIGGSIGTYFDKYSVSLQAILDERLPEYIERPELRQAAHPEEAVIYGCFIYANEKLGQK